MKRFFRSSLVAVIGLLITAQVAASAPIEPLGKLSLYGGAEREEGFPAGGRFSAELLGVTPLTQMFGLQGIAHYQAGRGSRFGLTAGPILGWDWGKAGFFVAYQYRTLNHINLVHLRPSVAFYLDQANINLWYSQPVSSPQRRSNSIEYGINQLQGTFSYFPASDWASWLRKDNVELTLGAQANTFAGAGSGKLDGAGVGPVFGVSFMPMRNMAVDLFHATIDNRSRYRVNAGIQFYFNSDNATLKALRRRYLEPNQDVFNGAGRDEKEPPPPAPAIPPPPIIP
jgi:hypothetical protein